MHNNTGEKNWMQTISKNWIQNSKEKYIDQNRIRTISKNAYPILYFTSFIFKIPGKERYTVKSILYSSYCRKVHIVLAISYLIIIMKYLKIYY